MSRSQPEDGRKGPRAGNIVNSSKSARPPWAMVTTGITSPQPPSTAFKASVLHVSHSFPHAGPGGRRIYGPTATCADPGRHRVRWLPSSTRWSYPSAPRTDFHVQKPLGTLLEASRTAPGSTLASPLAPRTGRTGRKWLRSRWGRGFPAPPRTSWGTPPPTRPPSPYTNPSSTYSSILFLWSTAPHASQGRRIWGRGAGGGGGGR